MTNFLNLNLWNGIEKYCKILDDLVIQPLNSETGFSNSVELSLSKAAYEKRKQEIENQILNLFNRVNDVNKLSIALFVFRSVTKQKMYIDSLNDWSIRFKICNYLFFLALKYLKNPKRTFNIIFDDKQFVKEMFFWGYTFFENQNLFNEQFFLGKADSIDNYSEEIDLVSNRLGDMHSYQIADRNLQKYLNMKNINIDKIRKNALDKYKQQYITKSELLLNESWKTMQLKDNKSNPEDDIVIIPMNDFKKHDKQLKKFIANFETEKCQSPSDPEADLIFSYKTSDFIYISKKLLSDTQTLIEAFITWGQYGNLTNYFWSLPIEQETLSNYNRLMTYKIADLLLNNDYTIPMENVNGLSIPIIETSNYVINKAQKNKLGDIDIIFYSIYTKTLYLIEYKNYQMMISREGDLSAEVSKVSREKTPEKVRERHNYICSNIGYCRKVLFKNIQDVKVIKSIILTTKPCYYFYLHKSEDYEYMEWTKFMNKVLSREL